MIVVCDTTPLNYLVLIDAVGVLPLLFVDVYAPTSVLQELSHSKAPAVVRQWALSPPKWLTIAGPRGRLPSTVCLDAGEADAPSLARERGIVDVLMDEFLGRKIVIGRLRTGH